MAFLGSAAFSGFPSIPGMLPGYLCLLNVQDLSSPLNVISLFSTLSSTSHGPRHVRFSSVAQSSPTLCDPMHCSMPGLTVHHQLPEFTQTPVHRASDAIHISSSIVPFSSHLQCFPASGSFPVSQFFASDGQVLEFQLHHHSLFRTAYSGLISFRMDWLDLLAVQGTLKSILQHHSSKAPILRGSAFFTVQFSHPYMTTGKTVA